MIRNIEFAPHEFYHVYSRGNNKRALFLQQADYIRFLFLILFFQFDQIFPNARRATNHYARYAKFDLDMLDKNSIRLVDLVSFALMPNHFHLLLCEREEKGISCYMQRVLNAYAKYFNIRNEQTGHLFEGPFRATHIENNTQLLHVSAYIHKNPKELQSWNTKEHIYPWSSYQDFVDKNRWKFLLKQEPVLEQFENRHEYKTFLKTSTAKETLGVLEDILIV